MKVYLLKDQEEKFKAKNNNAYFVVSYRLVDDKGNDLVQPWFKTKTQARDYAKSRQWEIIERIIKR